MTKHWISVRKIKDDQFTAEPDLGATRYLSVPDNEVPAPKHQVPVAQWTREIMQSFPTTPDGPSGDVLFFVHGYNNSVADVDGRHKAIQAGLTANNFPCVVISFDWPSGTDPLAYLPDRDNAKLTAIRMVNAGIKLFVRAQDNVCDINVHVLGHSTGAYVIREAFDHADGGQVTGAAWTVGQIALISGDVSSTSYSQGNPETDATYRRCYRFTNYSNGYDQVLQISNAKRAGFSPRVGRVGLPSDAPAKAVNVDCSPYYHATYGIGSPTTSHSWQFGDAVFLKDLTETIRGTLDRSVIPTRTAPDAARWQTLRPPA
jgi:pimeloyl-ACP methyl ester carboxylesterase